MRTLEDVGFGKNVEVRRVSSYVYAASSEDLVENFLPLGGMFLRGL
jgi:hypothetical protein